MKIAVCVSMVVLIGAMTACANEQTWTGQITDSTCGSNHIFDEHAAPITDRECTAECVKNGSQYVLVSNGKVYKIENQDNPSLARHAGDMVKLTGELKRDGIKVSTIEMTSKS